MKLKKNISVLLFLFFLCSNQISSASIVNYYGSGTVTLSEDTIKRFVQYLQGNFYSATKQKTEFLVSPINFYISEDGKNSLILYCDSVQSANCTPGVEIYQGLLRCNKIFNKTCKIFALEDEIVWNNKKIKIFTKKKEDIINELQKNNFVKTNTVKNISLDFKKSDKYSDMVLFEDSHRIPPD